MDLSPGTKTLLKIAAPGALLGVAGLCLYLALRDAPSQVVVHRQLHVQCIKCGYSWNAPMSDLPPDMLARRGGTGEPGKVDCPKCGAKQSVYMDTLCPKCGTWTITPWDLHPAGPPPGQHWDVRCPKCGSRM